MADKTISALKAATQLDDSSLMVAEQAGEAVKVPGSMFKQFAREQTVEYVEDAKTAANEAKAASAEAAEAAEAAGAHREEIAQNASVAQNAADRAETAEANAEAAKGAAERAAGDAAREAAEQAATNVEGRLSGYVEGAENARDAALAAQKAAEDARDAAEGIVGGDYVTRTELEDAIDAIPTTDISGKADKIVPAAVGNIATLDAEGNLVDGKTTPVAISNAAKPFFVYVSINSSGSQSCSTSLYNLRKAIDEGRDVILVRKPQTSPYQYLYPLNEYSTTRVSTGGNEYYYFNTGIQTYTLSYYVSGPSANTANIFPSVTTGTVKTLQVSGGTMTGILKAAADSTPTVAKVRNSSLNAADATPTANGEICWTYK